MQSGRDPTTTGPMADLIVVDHYATREVNNDPKGAPTVTIPTTNTLQRTFLIRHGDSTGTAFAVELEGKEYLVTADTFFRTSRHHPSYFARKSGNLCQSRVSTVIPASQTLQSSLLTGKSARAIL